MGGTLYFTAAAAIAERGSRLDCPDARRRGSAVNIPEERIVLGPHHEIRVDRGRAPPRGGPVAGDAAGADHRTTPGVTGGAGGWRTGDTTYSVVTPVRQRGSLYRVASSPI